MLDLQTISQEIKESIDEAIIKNSNGEPRKHLGASEIGHECKAYLWFGFRWGRLGQTHDARMIRLFERGQLEEIRFVKWLVNAGWNVKEFDPQTGNQFRMIDVMGHYGGSLDGIAFHPNYPQLGEVLLEFKTKGTGKGFNELLEKGVALTNGQHFSQMSQYGKAYNLKYGLYQTINKNDDSLHVEVVELDYNRAALDLQKAYDIITSQIRPEKVSPNETYFRCKYCKFVGVCQRGDTMDLSCRSCINASPIENGQWYCSLYANTIPQEFIIKGCQNWQELEH